MFGKGLSSNDIQALTQFNNQIKNGISYSQAYKNSLSNCSVAGKQMAVQIAKGKVSVDSLTNASKASAIGMGLLNTAMNFGIMMAVTGLIELGKYLWKLVPTTEHLKKKLEETSQALADIKSERESLNDELKTTQERIAELEAKGVLSFTDEAELKRLNQENAALKTKIELLDIEAKKKREENQDNFNSVLTTARNRNDNVSWEETHSGGRKARASSATRRYDHIGDKDKLLELAKIYDEVIEKEEYIDGKGISHSIEDVEEEITNFSSVVQEYQGYLDDLYQDGFDYNSADEKTKQNINFANEMIDRYMALTGKFDTMWEHAYNSDRFSEAHTAIEKLGTATAESLSQLYKDNDKVKEFVEYILSLGTIDWKTVLGKDFDSVAGDDKIVSTAEALGWMNENADNSAKVMGLVANKINKVEEATEGAASNVKTFSDAFKSIKESTSILADAYSDIEDGGEISLEHLMSLIDKYPDLVDYINLENGQHNITKDILKAKFELEKKNILLEIEGNKKVVQSEIEKQKTLLNEIKLKKEAAKIDMANAMVSAGTFKNVNEALSAINARPGYYLRGFDWDVSDAKVAIADSEKRLKNLNAQETLFKNMSWDDIVSGSGSNKSDKKTIKKAEDRIAYYKHQHEMGLISEATYYKKLEEIRKKYYAGKKKYLDRDRELQEEYHDWEVSEAEDGFEDKVEALQEKYANGKITYAELKSKLKKLINTTFKNDKDTKNKYLDEELPDYLSDAKEQKEEKNRETFDSSYDKLKYQLENGFITEATYYKKLDALYKKHYGDKTKYLEEYEEYSQEVYDGFKDLYKEDLEAQKESLEEQKEAITEYYDDLIEKKQEEHDAEDYEKEQSEKRKEIFDLDMQIAELMRDGSEKAQARIAELEEERLQAIEDLNDFETDKAREDEIERLEKEKEAREKEVQDKIDNIDTTLGKLDSNTKDIRNAVIQYAKAKGVDIKFAYASGTRSSIGGFGRINEKGIEMISAPDGHGNYIPMLPSSYVFSAKATEFLWKLATEHSLPQAMYNSIAKSIKTQSNTPSVNIAQPITITMGDIIIKGNADKKTVADIKKQQENTVRMVLQKIKELQK